MRKEIEVKSQDVGFLINGAGGDWALREILPSLYILYVRGLLPSLRVLCLGRSLKDQAIYLARVSEAIKERMELEGTGDYDAEQLAQFLQRLHVVCADAGKAEDWGRIGDVFRQQVLPNGGKGIFINSVPPNTVADILVAFRGSWLAHDQLVRWTYLAEKPFGSSAKSARALYDQIREGIGWEHVFLVDHYLARYSVQNLQAMIRENAMLYYSWNAAAIERIEIVALENYLLNDRWQTYEGMALGALDDMILTHAANVAVILALDNEFRGRDVSEEQVNAAKLRLVQGMKVEEIFYGQYDDGALDGNPVAGYRKIAPQLESSTTPTYVAVKIVFSTGALAGVPFYIQSGKGLAEKRTHINVLYRKPPTADSDYQQRLRFVLFAMRGSTAVRGMVQQDEIVRSLDLPYSVHPVRHELDVRGKLGGKLFLPYAKAIFDAARGHHQTFVNPEVQIALWEVFDPEIAHYKHTHLENRPLALYPAGVRFPHVPWWSEEREAA